MAACWFFFGWLVKKKKQLQCIKKIMWKLQRTSCKFNNTWLFYVSGGKSETLHNYSEYVCKYTSLFMDTYPGKHILRNVAAIKALHFDQTLRRKRTHNGVQETQRGTACQDAIRFVSSIGCALKVQSQAHQFHHIFTLIILSKTSVWLPDVFQFLCPKADLSVTW